MEGDYASSTVGTEGTVEASNEATSSSDTSSDLTKSEEFSKSKSGFDLKLTKSELVRDYRKNIINIYDDIIKELNSLFFALY